VKSTWFFSASLLVFFSSAFALTEQSRNGSVDSSFLREKLLPALVRPVNLLTDIKFRTRGPVPPKNNIAIVEIDSNSLDAYGRWPWHRDVLADLIDQVFALGARVVGLDIVFSEKDQRVPEKLKETLIKKGLGQELEANETDPVLGSAIAHYKKSLVLGWAADAICRPAYATAQDPCPATDPQAIASLPENWGKFSFAHFDPGSAFSTGGTKLDTAITLLANLSEYNSVAEHIGTFNTAPDNDGTNRRSELFSIVHGKPYASLALEMARLALQDELSLKLNSQGLVKTLELVHSQIQLPVTPLGDLAINFRGPGRTFKYISAYDVLNPSSPSHAKATEALKNAFVFIGISAVGVFDMRSFPFDNNVAGVEGHANILDNLLSGDALKVTSTGAPFWILLAIIIVGGILFTFAMEELEAVPAIAVFFATIIVSLAVDQYLFLKTYNLNTVYFYFEIISIFVLIIATKYISEQQNKKFLRNAFGKYVSPAVVDSILKNPEKLSLGGERKEVSIMFSDIRGFTTMSEGMDARKLSAFLNDYLGIMTKIVFDYQGTLDKYIGDAVMAFWGAPLEQPDHADLAVRACLEMMKALAENQTRFKAEHGVDVKIGIGLNSGAVSVGNMGSEQNFEYTVIGDHVNLASRLEGLTKAYGAAIVTSRFTFDCIEKSGKALPPHRVLDLVKVKGKKNAIELIQILDRDFPPHAPGLFQNARAHYKAARFDEAISLFREALAATNGSDKTCEIMIERCEYFKANPPGPNWDGSWEMHEK